MLRNVLFDLTRLSTAARFFKGELKLETNHYGVYEIPSYWGVVLNPLLGDYDPPSPPMENPLYQHELLFDAEGNLLNKVPQYIQKRDSDIDDYITKAEIIEWWGHIRKELIDDSPVFPRINAMRARYKKNIEEFEAMWWEHNSD